MVEKVLTDDNLADMFTKVLDRVPFVKLRRLTLNLVIRCSSCSSSISCITLSLPIQVQPSSIRYQQV